MIESVPNHVAIIMDGNGRWALSRGKKRSEGHLEGSKTLEKLCLHALKRNIKILSVFAFSTENFKRDKEEVDYLMNLITKYLKKEADKFKNNNIKVIVSGSKIGLNEDVIEAIKYIEEYTKDNTKAIFNICLNYGGQQEIIDACKKIALEYKEGNIDLNLIDNEGFSKYLYYDLEPIDLLIRTSGELRISNFMLFQAAYSEFYFTDTYFPDFKEEEFDKAIEVYKKRKRRFGGV